MYAIIDIETTGGQYNEEGITEIAIYKYDGVELVDQFISLINPQIPIQPFVVKLTGINNQMLVNAPKFYEVAKRIVEITEDCIIVAHNAIFDYRILQTEFGRLGYHFQKPTLCTVELSKKLIPDLPSYSLGKLVKSLGIPLSDRHRASGDALATLQLFKLLLDKDLNKEIPNSIQLDQSPKKKISKFFNLIEPLPSKMGIYYFYDNDDQIIYIGKSKNIKNSVSQNLTNNAKVYKEIQKKISNIQFELTGSELITNIKEREEIKRLKPKYNKSSRKSIFPFAIYLNTLPNGLLELELKKTDGRKTELFAFINQNEALNFLNNVQNELQKTSQDDILSRNNELLEKIEIFNTNYKNHIIIDKGRNSNEKSGVVIQNSEFKGIVYFQLNHQINKIEILNQILVPMQNNREIRNLIHTFLRKNKYQKILPIEN